jgi:hypothetical protein
LFEFPDFDTCFGDAQTISDNVVFAGFPASLGLSVVLMTLAGIFWGMELLLAQQEACFGKLT